MFSEPCTVATASLAWPAAVQAQVRGVVLGWCLVRTEPHKENTAKYWLERIGLEVFLPLYLRKRYSRRNSRKMEAAAYPLFPRYLFVRGAVRRSAVEDCIGVAGLFITANGSPQITSDDVIQAIRDRVDPDTGFIPVEANSSRPALARYFEKDQRLRVTDGPYTDLRGLFIRPEDANHVRVSLRFMGGAIEHIIPNRWVEAA